MTQLQIIYKKPADLVPFSRNSRKHSEAQIEQLIKSIDEFGFTNPILLDGDNGIIAGHGRLAAAVKMKLDKVPTIELAGLTENQKRAYVIADNKLALNASWDDQILMFELQDLESLDVDLDILGFSDAEIGKLFTQVEETDLTNRQYAEEEWKGMPEFTSNDPCYRKVVVNFDTAEDVDNFFLLLGQEYTEKTKSIWFPEKENRNLKDVRWDSSGEEK